MKRIAKHIVSLAMVLTMLMSMTSFASAASTKSISISPSYNKYATCKLVNARKSGTVRIKVWNTDFRYGYTNRNSVKMTTTSGKYIWEERGAISWNGNRNFYLGNDNRTYRIYVKTYYGKGCADFTARGNVTIS